MAPVSNDEELRLAPLALVTSHIAATAYLTYTVGRSLYRSRKALSPSQETRLRVTQRFKLTTAFGTLAALGSVFAVTSWYKYLRLSYNVWATERGIGIPNSLFSTSEWYLRQWLSDTPIYLDALEIVAEKSRRLWWGQQLDLATISWTTLVAIEGRRRNISHLWAYALLAHLVSLSFAQNLFHVALLLTPSPSPSPIQTSTTYLTRFFPPKPNNWLPNQGLFISSLVLNYGVSLWLPYAAGTPSFPVAATLAKVLSFAPLALNTFAPQSWGIVYREPHSSYRAITKVFQFISTASTLLHTKTTLISVFYNLPESHKHRHSIKIPFDTEERSKWERSATSIERVLASINDHPAVTAAGKDVLLCALSLGLWAAVRAVDLGKMLHSVTPLYKSTESTLGTGDDAAAVSVAEPNTKKPSPGRASGTSMNLRRRGKSTRADADSLDGSNGELQTQKRRGRPRKSKGSLEPSPEADPKPEVDDSAYKPTLAGKEDINLGDVVVDDDFDWEAASLAWGLTALGGWELARLQFTAESASHAKQACIATSIGLITD